MVSVCNKLKSATSSSSNAHPPTLDNPILQFFNVGKQTSSAGPELIWRIHDAQRKSDKKLCSVFVLDKRVADKLFRSKRKETMLDRIRDCVLQLEELRHPKMLQIIHTVEEGPTTLAFASEHVLASLHHILVWHESTPVAEGAPEPILPHPRPVVAPNPQPQDAAAAEVQRPPFAKEYYFLDFELRYGILQIIEALHYLHNEFNVIHRNVCPQVIIICRRGTWKLFGLEFVEDIISPDPSEMIHVPQWSKHQAKISQPNLDYAAPEVQITGQCNVLSDMFSLGMVICALFNYGHPLIQANNSPALYIKQIEHLSNNVDALLPRIPPALQEAVERLCARDPHTRPNTQLLPLIKYFKCQVEPAIHAMQLLDVITVKDAATRSDFYRTQLIAALPFVPKKLRWHLVWPALLMEVRSGEVLPAAVHSILWMTNDSSPSEFSAYISATIKGIMTTSKNVPAIVAILENMHIILQKCDKKDLENEILPLFLSYFDSSNSYIQTSSLIALQRVTEYIDDKSLQNVLLGKVRILLEKNRNDVKVICLVLGFFEKVLARLDRAHVMEHVIPTLLAIKLTDPDIMNRVVKLYKAMLYDNRFSVTTNMMATKMIPALAPQTINPNLNFDQFTNLMEILFDMLANIDKTQRLVLKLENVPPEPVDRYRALRLQMSTDNVIAPPFNIPNLRVEQRKTSSAEDMVRKHSITGLPPTGSVGSGFKSTGIGQWFFGSHNSNTDNNFLRVGSIYPSRRLSDNTLLTPKIRIAPSCASSPGGSPGGSAGLPVRRHSSIGPQERRGSAINLSPPTAGYRGNRGRGGSGSSLSVPATSQSGGGSVPNTSSSVPFLLTSSMQSIRSRSRRASGAANAAPGSSLLHQISTGMVRHPSMRTPPPLPPPARGPPPTWGPLQAAIKQTALAVRKVPSLNISLT